MTRRSRPRPIRSSSLADRAVEPAGSKEHRREAATPGLGGSGFGFFARRWGWSGGRPVGGSGCDGGLGSGLCENPGRKSVGAAATGGLAASLAWTRPAGPSIVVVATVLFAVGLAVGTLVRGRVG